jgi:DNA processing protein
VVEALGSTPTAVDELVRRCQVSAATLSEVLLALELEGRLERHRGNRVSLI